MDMKETNSPVTTADTENNKTLDPIINNKIDTENISDSQDKLSDITSPEVSPKSNKIPLVIRCPFTTTDLNIYIDPTHNVLHLKKKIYKEFPSNPKPSDQRLIFGGRIINNNEILQDVLKRQLLDLSTPPIIHLIINSLAIKHAQTIKPSSSNNSENVSTTNSVQNSPAGSKQNLNETASTSTNNISNTTTISNNTTNQSSSSTIKETPAATTSEESKPSSSVNNVAVTTKPISYSNTLPDGVQYILLNNVIYAVQPSPEYLSNGDSRYKIQAPIDIKSTTGSETINESSNTNENNNNNDNNNAQPAVDNANANNNNGQQEILNQILNDNDQQRQQPNQFFLFIRLAFIVYLLTQGGGYIRMFIVSFIAIIIFLVQTGRIRVTVINYRDLPGVNAAENNNNNVNQNEQQIIIIMIIIIEMLMLIMKQQEIMKMILF
ncbi:hypothetical protein LY90DRAFT_81602 [Neocallimastix californiae]|uniref:Ubiquitin-like domain-containing protein n=1 Tax=Neocallimastix californiae TaxID=1754190 RepID=A0A1Y2B8J6_9FUNG|nr:hypothetical protein LY90DRAFT_81602 [Neocallimastix californiae]|eukprot:ORY30425.1 hypothetical protein LY90DRAFT_81602 [Neocallimastix californiae]